MLAGVLITYSGAITYKLVEANKEVQHQKERIEAGSRIDNAQDVSWLRTACPAYVKDQDEYAESSHTKNDSYIRPPAYTRCKNLPER